MNRLQAFLLGWRQRSAMLLDEAGCPEWLIRWRCPVPISWGDAMVLLGLDSWMVYSMDKRVEAFGRAMRAIRREVER